MFGSNPDTFRKQMEFFGDLSSEDMFLRMRNLHVGQRAFVLGNGPSLKTADLQRLQGEITFAANKIYLCYDQTDFRPTYWCCSDKLVAEQNRAMIGQLKHLKIGAFSVEQHLAGLPGVHIVKAPTQASGGQGLIADIDMVAGVHPGVAVTIFMLKLALWMGMSPVYLMGIDFSFIVPEGSVTREQIFGNNVIVSTGEENHFHPDYRKPGEKWMVPQLDAQRADFGVMKWRYEAAGCVVYNASRKTALNVFEKVDFDQIVA